MQRQPINSLDVIESNLSALAKEASLILDA